MRRFSEYNPIVIAVYFLLVTGLAMFCAHPAILGFALLGGTVLSAAGQGQRRGKTALWLCILFLLLALFNPLFSHNGVTVLFVLNHAPITLEALLYGVCSAARIVSVLCFLQAFTRIMTGEKLLYLFGAISPKLSLVFSMAIRYVPLFQKQAARVNQAQKAMGLYKEDNVIDGARGGLRVFSVMVTWALENGITTADSMSARGYGVGRRTHYSVFRWHCRDVALLCICLLLGGVTVGATAAGALDFVFYPAIRLPERQILGILGFFAYAVLVLLPNFIDGGRELIWRYLRSKI